MDAVTAAPASSATEPRWRIVAAFAIVYVVWGTTYFAIGEVVHTVPPLLMTSARFLVAGLVLHAWRRGRGCERPTLPQWRAAAVVAAFMLLGGYGLTAWAQQRVPSGLAALLVSITPVVIVLIDWWRPGGARPGLPVGAGLVLGTIGLLLLIGPARLEAARGADLVSTLACLAAALLWAVGSVGSRHARQSPDVFLAAAMQMLCGAAWLAVAALATGEVAAFSREMITWSTVFGWLYLTFAGSLGAFTSYIYLLKVAGPARASTYAYVNPAIAVFVGWALGGEVVTLRVVFAGALLIGGVALINIWKGRR